MKTPQLSHSQILHLRTHHQHLDPQPPASASEIVAGVCGIQAQDLPSARLSIHTRSPGLSLAEVEGARLVERSIVRTWGPRGTLHLVAAQDLGWLLPLVAPPVAASENKRQLQLGLDAATRRRGIEVIVKALEQHGPLEREALRQALAQAGLPHQGQATIHLIRLAGLEGQLCYGAEQGRRQPFVLSKDWIQPRPAPLEAEAAPAKLARRYLRAYAPAGERDLASWSGVGLPSARHAFELIQAELVQVEAAGAPAWLFPEQLEWLYAETPQEDRAPILRLLPAFDTYLLGYANRDAILPPEHARRVNKGGGWILPTMLLDGQVVGTWKSHTSRQQLQVDLAPFEPLPEDLLAGFQAVGGELAHFLGYNTT